MPVIKQLPTGTKSIKYLARIMLYLVMLKTKHPLYFETQDGTGNIEQFVQMVMGLALLPPEGVVPALGWLREMAKSAPAKELLLYYENVWTRRWKPTEVSVFGRKIRTNNDLEGRENPRIIKGNATHVYNACCVFIYNVFFSHSKK